MALSWKEGEADLKEALAPIATPKGTSATKVKTASALCLRMVKDYKRVVHAVETLMWKSEHRLGFLYLIDAIIRQSQAKFGSEKDLFAPRFSQHLSHTISSLKQLPDDGQEHAHRIVYDWVTRRVFTKEQIIKAGGADYVQSPPPQHSPPAAAAPLNSDAEKEKLAILLDNIKRLKQQQEEKVPDVAHTSYAPPASDPRAFAPSPRASYPSSPRSRTSYAPPQQGGPSYAPPRPSPSNYAPPAATNYAPPPATSYAPPQQSYAGYAPQSYGSAPPAPRYSQPRRESPPRKQRDRSRSRSPRRSRMRSRSRSPPRRQETGPPPYNGGPPLRQPSPTYPPPHAAFSGPPPSYPPPGPAQSNTPFGQPQGGYGKGICRDYTLGRCFRGAACRFLHEGPTSQPPEAARAPLRPGQLKTRLCMNFPAGGCRFGDRCTFAHGEAQLGTTVDAMPPRSSPPPPDAFVPSNASYPSSNSMADNTFGAPHNTLPAAPKPAGEAESPAKRPRPSRWGAKSTAPPAEAAPVVAKPPPEEEEPAPAPEFTLEYDDDE
ncbi:hypothetical protein ACHHYP_12217 [Achlya hypogyna]|uniref:C3H1-type domain-containing protein n=1 Tax=Achlya hypogyna TaxID=1202772 RepID=A0A1V9ZH29_ACHHY|nr:hypothetical protein ACHHYP_12217 [Achlya hypogyna]